MIYELYSHRKKKIPRSGEEDVYQYDTVPKALRVQVQQILVEAIGPQYLVDGYTLSSYSHNPEAWQFIHKTLCRELGVHKLAAGGLEIEQVLDYIGTPGIEGFLDALELSARVIERVIGDYNDHKRKEHGIKETANEAIGEINHRLRECGLGYRYEDGTLIRVDSEFSHELIIKPALNVLRGKEFAGAQVEFLEAHRFYRAGEYSQAIVEAAKSFESTLKAACNINGWRYEKGARASDLLKKVRSEGLWPAYLDGSFDQLLATLSSGLPKVRNEEGAHGQGAVIRAVPEYIATYALHLAAAKIRLIAEAAYARKH